MSDRSKYSQKTIASIAEEITAVTNVAAVGGRSFSELVNATDLRKSGSVTTKPKGAPNNTPSLSPAYQANTTEEIASLLTPLISKRFELSNSVTKKLRTQLGL